MPRMSSDSFSLMPSVSSFILNECCRLTIHWKRFVGNGLYESSSGRLLSGSATELLMATQWIFIVVSSLMYTSGRNL